MGASETINKPKRNVFVAVEVQILAVFVVFVVFFWWESKANEISNHCSPLGLKASQKPQTSIPSVPRTDLGGFGFG